MPRDFGEEDFSSFSHYKSMEAIYCHDGHLVLRTTTICTYFLSPFSTRVHIKFGEIWPRDFRGVVVQMIDRMDGQTDVRTDKQTDDGRRVITIAHSESLA